MAVAAAGATCTVLTDVCREQAPTLDGYQPGWTPRQESHVLSTCTYFVGMQPGRGLGASTSTSPCCRKPSQPRPLIHTHQSNPGSRSSREQTYWARLGYAVICRATTPPTYHHRRSPPHRVTKVKVDIGGVHSGSDTHFPATHARFLQYLTNGEHPRTHTVPAGSEFAPFFAPARLNAAERSALQDARRDSADC